MRARSLLIGGVLIASACGDLPVEAPREGGEDALTPAAALAASSCTKRWASGIGGLWADPSRWSPNGVPGPIDAVCIDAPGAYDILATQGIAVLSLVIGGDSANVTFDFDPPTIDLGISAVDGLTVLPGSELNVLSKGLAWLGGEFLANSGTIDIENVCACGGFVAILVFNRIDNYDRMELDAPMVTLTWRWTNGMDGAIVTSGQGVIETLQGSLLRNSGQIVGATQIEVDNFDWLSGTVGEIAPVTSAVLVTGGVVNLSFSDESASGLLEVAGDGNVAVNGWVPPQVEIEIQAFSDGTVDLGGQTPTSPFKLDGRVSVSTVGHNRIVFDDLVIRGTLQIWGTGSAEFAGERLLNKGVIRGWGSDLSFTSNGGTLRNAGIMESTPNVVSLTMGPGTEFVSDGGTVDPSIELVLDGATLRGTGTVGSVTSLGGSVGAGLPHGVLSADDLTLDPASQLVFNHHGALHGTLEVAYDLALDGTLRVNGTGTSGYGVCGDVLTAVRHDGVTPSGAFANFAGLSTGPQTSWRAAMLPDSVMLAGYETVHDLTVRTDNAFAKEGGHDALATLCLGPTAPVGDVAITATSILGQLLDPPAVTFDLDAWMLPKSLTVSAVDDAVVEPPLVDTLTFASASADPNYNGSLSNRTRLAVADNDGSTDLEVIVQNAPDTVAVGGVFEVAFRVTNHGPTESTGSGLIIRNPGGNVTFRQAFGATCAADPGVLRCDVPGIDAGAQEVIVIVYEVAAAGDVTLDATVTAHQPDANPGNDSAAASIVVN